MKGIVVRPLREDEKRRFFEWAESLPSRDFWGKKGSYLRRGLERFESFFEYIKPFEPKCFFVAEEDDKLLGFVVALYNSEWVSNLIERYGYDIGRRAHILGMAFIQRRKDVLNALTVELVEYFSKKEIETVEYPTFGNICLTTATDVLTPENVDALLLFREAGFKISECYYSMKLELDIYKCSEEYPIESGSFRFKERSIEIVLDDEVLGKITWDPVENRKTSIDICVTRSYRGKGLGTRLMAKALHRLKAEGIKVIEIGVDGNNLPALKIYRKFGFEVCVTHFYILKPC
ncbi:MAG: GNAT family N-acetyltransferase [Candidatus Bathyarchaeota archaeon]|jgi:ribosomal protein S18 acetylase RimI-like enzyme